MIIQFLRFSPNGPESALDLRAAVITAFGISCSSLLSSLVTLIHTRSRHNHATARGGGGGGPRWVTATPPLDTELAPIKRGAGGGAAQTPLRCASQTLTRVMERTFREQFFFLVLCLSVLKGDSRYIENNEILKDELYSFFNSELKRETPEELMYRRALRCLDMVAVEGQFTFTAEHPQLSCAAFFMAEPNEVISVDYDSVDIDCRGGDFITVFDGWVMKGEKFPSSQDHTLPLYERYVDYCDSGSLRRTVRSSQNVAMVFFRVHGAGSSFTLTVRKHVNPFPCNVLSQSPEGSYTMVIPQQRRNCSFSIIYPVAIDVSEFSLGHYNNFPKRTMPGCGETGDFVQLLGGNGIDTSKLLPITDLCMSFSGPTHMKIGCDNTVVRMVSSGKFVNRVSFSYRLLDNQELQTIKLNNVEDFCFNN